MQAVCPRKSQCALLLFVLLFCTGALAQRPIPSPPQISAKGHLLLDFDSGRVLAENGATNRLEPASLTKIMTAYVVFKELEAGNIRLDDQVLISEKAWRTPGSRMFVEVGKKVSLELLLKGTIIQSGNDASVALAEHTAGSEASFAEMMNDHARRLDMLDTHFANSTGLPNIDHYTTPRDIAKVTAASIREFPDLYAWYAIKDLEFNNIKQRNRNLLLWRDDTVDGVKTGHTEAAGYCLVASAQKGNMRLIAVVMGTDSEEARARDSLSLLNYGFRFFETHRLYSAGESLSDTRVWKGAVKQLQLGLAEDLHITIPRGRYENLSAQMELNPRIIAPVRKGKSYGEVKVSLDGEEIARVPLVALEDVAEGGLWRRIMDGALLWWQ